MDNFLHSLPPGMQLLYSCVLAVWCLFWAILTLSACWSVLQTIGNSIRYAYQNIGFCGIAIVVALLIFLSIISDGLILIVLGIITLGSGALYYFLNFWFLQFPGYFRKWRKLPIATRILSVALPYDLVFSLVRLFPFE